MIVGALALLLLVALAVTQLSGAGDSKSAVKTPSGLTGSPDASTTGANGNSDQPGPVDPESIHTVEVSLGSPMNSATGDGLLWMTGVDG